MTPILRQLSIRSQPHKLLEFIYDKPECYPTADARLPISPQNLVRIYHLVPKIKRHTNFHISNLF